MSRRRRHHDHDQPAIPPAPGPYVLDEDALFAFLEHCLEGTEHRDPAPDQLAERVYELVNDDWDEEQATHELVRVAGTDYEALSRLHRRIQAGLLGNPWVDVPSIRASRIALRAMRELAGR